MSDQIWEIKAPLWDFYAAAALQGLITRSGGSSSYVRFAEEAAKFADVMIAERERRGIK